MERIKIFAKTIEQEALDQIKAMGESVAYKPIEEIIECIEPTVTILKQIKPIYNFKAK